ncbi:MAG: AAA family ATPase [Planctomycetaceae bacterium]|nr:AAA family ATPase [Planctomycetales bacterium]MCB9921468.1 AAA family ATPase [Planctomycetaceae bacterium]
MKITRIVIPNFQQFREFDLSLTDPTTGEPLDRVCFIGRNGTGKTTLLRLVFDLLGGVVNRPSQFLRERGLRGDLGVSGLVSEESGARPGDHQVLVALKVLTNFRPFWVCSTRRGEIVLCGESIEGDDWNRVEVFRHRISGLEEKGLTEQLSWTATGGALFMIAPPDGTTLITQGKALPDTNLNNALRLFKEFPVFHEVSVEHIAPFWNVLIYHLKKREEDWQTFLQQRENRQKSVQEAEEEFARNHPEILVELAELWNTILAAAGLEFDYESAKKPVQLSENLEAFVRVASSGQPINYNALSTGIRNFIFRIGHIYSLYFGRQIKRGVLLLDEPENSLYPDFLYDLMSVYWRIICNTQFFTATHSPIIAAQFRPEERVILDFDDAAYVVPHRGVTPIGDDPNDMLNKDFEVRSLYGKEGIENWERFLQLRREIPAVTDPQQKQHLIQEYMRIGNAYNFAPDAIS